MNLVEKIQWVNSDGEAKKIYDYRSYSIPDLMLFINNKFADKIKDHIVLQKIIDTEFVTSTKKTYTVILFFYIVTFCIPFVINLTHDVLVQEKRLPSVHLIKNHSKIVLLH